MKFKSDIEVQAGLKDSSGTAGTSGKILSSTGTGVAWVDDNPGITGSGTTNYVPKFTGSSALGNSLIYDNGTNIEIGGGIITNKSGGTFWQSKNGATNYFIIGNDSTIAGGSVSDINYYAYLGNQIFSTGGSERMRLTTNGELLIGRTSSYGAGWQLAVEGNIYAKNDLRIDANASFGGSVGIGTASTPATKLQVDSANMATDTIGNVFISATNALAANIGGQLTLGGFYNGSSKYAFGGIAARKENATSGNVAGYLALMSTTSAGALTERMRITSGGNVGIGTTSPTHLLSVENSSSYETASFKSSSVPYQIIGNAAVGDYWRGFFTGQNIVTNATTGKPSVKVSGYTASAIAYSADSSQGYLGFFTTSSTTANTDLSERMRITSGGNVGIGTTSPSALLNVVGASDMSGTFETTGTNNAASLILKSGNGTTSGLYSYLRFINNNTNQQDWRIGTYGNNDFSFVNVKAGTTPFVINTSGNVGIGTTSPLTISNYKIVTTNDVSGSGYAAQTNGVLSLYNYSNANGSTISEQRALPLIIETNGSERMRITSGGNVGIGTTTDAGYKLDVNGTGRFLDNLTVNKEGGIIGIDASNNPRIGFVKKSGEQPFLAFASAPFLLKVSSGSEIFASNTFTTVLSIATSGAATISSLAGTGTRLVTANASGVLSTTTDGAITTYNSTLTLDTTWKNTGITSANIGAQGVYLVTCLVNDYGVGGGQYSCTYVGTMFFYTSGTNGVNANEIALHHSGHADNNRYIYLRTLSSVATGDSKLYLQIKGNGSNSGNSTYAFTFKKLL